VDIWVARFTFLVCEPWRVAAKTHQLEWCQVSNFCLAGDQNTHRLQDSSSLTVNTNEFERKSMSLLLRLGLRYNSESIWHTQSCSGTHFQEPTYSDITVARCQYFAVAENRRTSRHSREDWILYNSNSSSSPCHKGIWRAEIWASSHVTEPTDERSECDTPPN